MFLILIAIGWLYVALMMAVAEATSPVGSVLGAIITFIFYGVGPVALVLYILGTPARKRRRRAREHAEHAAAQAARSPDPSAPDLNTQESGQPDAGSHAAADTVAPVRKEA